MGGTEQPIAHSSLVPVRVPRRTESLNPAATEFARIAVPLAGVALVATWFVSSYTAIAPTQLLSYVLDDKWCDLVTQGVGQHCFGDYALADDLFATDDPWHSALSGDASWPPLAWLPALLAYKVGGLTGIRGSGAVLFAVVSALAMMTPAWWATRYNPRWVRVTALTLGGAATAPFIATIDRGNPVGLTVPLVLWAAVAYRRGRWTAMTAAVVSASLIKPQLIVLLLLPLLHRRFRQVLLGGFTSALLTTAGFLLFPHSFPSNVIAWARELTDRTGDYQPLDQVYPYNIGVGRSLLSLVDASGLRFLIGSSHRETVIGLLTLAGPAILVVSLGAGAFALWRGHKRLGPAQTVALALLLCLYTSSTVYFYYLILLLVPLALLARDPSELPSADADAPARTRSTTVAVTVLACVLAPVLIPVSADWFGHSVVSFGQVEIQTVGLWQVLAGPLVLAWFVWLVVAGLWPAWPHWRRGSLERRHAVHSSEQLDLVNGAR